MGDLVAVRNRAIETGKKACDLDKDHKYEEAFNKYIESIELFQHVVKCIHICFMLLDETNTQLKTTFKSKLEEYFKRATYIKTQIKAKTEPVPAAGFDPDSAKGKGYPLIS